MLPESSKTISTFGLPELLFPSEPVNISVSSDIESMHIKVRMQHTTALNEIEKQLIEIIRFPISLDLRSLFGGK